MEIALQLGEQTVMTMAWIASRLQMGTRTFSITCFTGIGEEKTRNRINELPFAKTINQPLTEPFPATVSSSGTADFLQYEPIVAVNDCCSSGTAVGVFAVDSVLKEK